MSVMYYELEVSASAWLLVQRTPTERGVSECDCEAAIMRRPWPTMGWCTMGKILIEVFNCGGSDSQYDTSYERNGRTYDNDIYLLLCTTARFVWKVEDKPLYITQMLVTALIHYAIRQIWPQIQYSRHSLWRRTEVKRNQNNLERGIALLFL
jgi:hypothetical protein